MIKQIIKNGVAPNIDIPSSGISHVWWDDNMISTIPALVPKADTDYKRLTQDIIRCAGNPDDSTSVGQGMIVAIRAFLHFPDGSKVFARTGHETSVNLPFSSHPPDDVAATAIAWVDSLLDTDVPILGFVLASYMRLIVKTQQNVLQTPERAKKNIETLYNVSKAIPPLFSADTLNQLRIAVSPLHAYIKGFIIETAEVYHSLAAPGVPKNKRGVVEASYYIALAMNGMPLLSIMQRAMVKTGADLGKFISVSAHPIINAKFMMILGAFVAYVASFEATDLRNQALKDYGLPHITPSSKHWRICRLLRDDVMSGFSMKGNESLFYFLAMVHDYSSAEKILPVYRELSTSVDKRSLTVWASHVHQELCTLNVVSDEMGSATIAAIAELKVSGAQPRVQMPVLQPMAFPTQPAPAPKRVRAVAEEEEVVHVEKVLDEVQVTKF